MKNQPNWNPKQNPRQPWRGDILLLEKKIIERRIISKNLSWLLKSNLFIIWIALSEPHHSWISWLLKSKK